MKSKLQQLFDMQYFVQNSRLQGLIDDVMIRYQLPGDAKTVHEMSKMYSFERASHEIMKRASCAETAREVLDEADLEMLYAAGDGAAVSGEDGCTRKLTPYGDAR